MAQIPSQHKNRLETVFVLSFDDAEKIEEMLRLAREGLLELLESRRVDFPNVHCRNGLSVEKQLAEYRKSIALGRDRSEEF